MWPAGNLRDRTVCRSLQGLNQDNMHLCPVFIGTYTLVFWLIIMDDSFPMFLFPSWLCNPVTSCTISKFQYFNVIILIYFSDLLSTVWAESNLDFYLLFFITFSEWIPTTEWKKLITFYVHCHVYSWPLSWIGPSPTVLTIKQVFHRGRSRDFYIYLERNQK